jgi:hypothetical protein
VGNQDTAARTEVDTFSRNLTTILAPSRARRGSEAALLSHLEALTFDFEREGQRVSAILVYAEPDPERSGVYHPIIAQDMGYEGIACLDDTARAASLALAVYERTGSRTALSLARRWLTFVEYMQYPDGSFANFIRNAAGVRNATGLTSYRGGHWWSARALLALARAFRVTHDHRFLERYEACQLPAIPDGKIQALLALAKLELYRARPAVALREAILEHCTSIIGSGDVPYFPDLPGEPAVSLWGYHQLHAVAASARLLERSDFLASCRRTVQHLIEPDVQARFWHSYPDRRKDGVCAYDVAPIVQGLAAMHRATGAKRYRELALRAAAWFYGRNDARTAMYDPTTGRCRDGISGGIASINCGAESAIEAGFAELERRDLSLRP